MTFHHATTLRRARSTLWLAMLAIGVAGAGVTSVSGFEDESDSVVGPAESHDESAAGSFTPIPPKARRTSPAAQPVRGGFVSVQVNVDDNGDNIINDAANEPSIAIDPNDPNIMAIGWRQFDTIFNNFRQAGVGASQDGGASWSASVIDPGNFRSDPVLDSSPEGVLYYYSLGGNFICDVYSSFDGGQTWGQPVFAWGGDKQWFTVDKSQSAGRGFLHAAWSNFGNPFDPDQFTRSTDNSASWMSPIELPDPKPRWGTLTVDANGTLYLCGRTVSDEFRVLRSSNARNEDETPTWDWNRLVNLGGTPADNNGPNPGGILGQTWIAADRSGGEHHGNIYVLSSVNPSGSDPFDVKLIRSEDGGETWSTAVRVNDDPPDSDAWQWFGTMSVAPNGRIDVVWNDTRNSLQTNICELFYAYSEDGGRTWSENIAVSPAFDSWVGWPQQAKIGDYYDMVSDATGAGLAYAATFNGEQDVYYLRLEPPVCPDLDEDGVVAFGDVLAILGAWGPCGECPEDVDGSGVVDFADIVELLAAWGPCPLVCCLPADECDDAPIVGDGTYRYSTFTATTNGPNLPAECDEGRGTLMLKDVWLRYEAPCDGTATVSLCDSSFDTRIGVYADDGCPGSLIACSDDACGDGGTRSEVSFAVEAGTVYVLRIASRSQVGEGLVVIGCD